MLGPDLQANCDVEHMPVCNSLTTIQNPKPYNLVPVQLLDVKEQDIKDMNDREDRSNKVPPCPKPCPLPRCALQMRPDPVYACSPPSSS